MYNKSKKASKVLGKVASETWRKLIAGRNIRTIVWLLPRVQEYERLKESRHCTITDLH